MADQYIAFNAAVPTTAAMTAVATGTAIKTLLQVTAPSTRRLTVVRWGITFTGSPSAIQVELIHTTTVAGGSPTAVTPTILTDGAPASLATAGFSPSSEGTVVATTRVFDTQILSTNNYSYEFSLGREPILPVSGVLRVRTTSAASVSATCWVAWEE
jgi:hypothetical protein